jgi:hypothetical protein
MIPVFVKHMTSKTLNKYDTELWDSDAPEGEALRKAWRKEAQAASKELNGTLIELYSYDNILLDAITY